MQRLVLIIILFLLLPATVLAQDKSTTTSPREKLQQKRVDIRANAATRTAELKAKLSQFKDKKKAEVAQKVNDNLNKINKNRTDHFLKFLDKAAGILNKVETRVNGIVGKDTTSAKAAIADARVSLASAKAAVQAQAAKDYTITISSETKVRSDVTSVRDRLHQDLQAIRKQVVDAKQSVANAIKVASTSLGGNKNGTK